MPRGRPRQEPKLVRRIIHGKDIWFIQWHDEATGETRRRSTGLEDHGPAYLKFEEWKAQQEAAGKAVGAIDRPRHPDEITIAEVLTFYVAGHSSDIASPERIGYASKHLLAWWTDARVSAISPVMCRQYRDARLKQPHPKTHKLPTLGTITRELAVLRAAVIWCENNKKSIKGQAPFVEVPGKQPGKDRWLTRGEAARLLWAARKEPKARLHLPLFVLLGLYSGARSGAILSLKWLQVDLVRGTIDFNEPGRPRTNKRRAKIQIPAPLKLALRRVQRRTNSPDVINYLGTPIKQIKHAFAQACTRAGLTDVTPHTLRHTCGTWLAQRGVPLWEIAGWLGHSLAETTELYAHHHPDHLANARTALDRRERTGTQP